MFYPQWLGYYKRGRDFLASKWGKYFMVFLLHLGLGAVFLLLSGAMVHHVVDREVTSLAADIATWVKALLELSNM